LGISFMAVSSRIKSGAETGGPMEECGRYVPSPA
jgi:hypothetical protein